MLITINEQEYFLVWNYFFNANIEKEGRDVAQLVVKLNTEIVAEKFTLRNPKEKFEKSKARKYSIKKLLRDWGVSREERTKVWSQYFKIVKKR